MLFLLIYDSANNSSQYLRTMCEYTIQKSMKTKSKKCRINAVAFVAFTSQQTKLQLITIPSCESMYLANEKN